MKRKTLFMYAKLQRAKYRNRHICSSTYSTYSSDDTTESNIIQDTLSINKGVEDNEDNINLSWFLNYTPEQIEKYSKDTKEQFIVAEIDDQEVIFKRCSVSNKLLYIRFFYRDVNKNHYSSVCKGCY